MATGNRNSDPTAVEMAKVSAATLLSRVAESCPEERDGAIAGVLSIAIDECWPLLDAALRNDDDYNLRNAAMDVMVAYGHAAVPALIKLLPDANEEVRNFTAVMLGQIQDTRAVTALIAALEDEDANVRHAAAESLGKIGDMRALEPLKKMGDGDIWDLLISSEAIVTLSEAEHKI